MPVSFFNVRFGHFTLPTNGFALTTVRTSTVEQTSNGPKSKNHSFVRSRTLLSMLVSERFDHGFSNEHLIFLCHKVQTIYLHKQTKRKNKTKQDTILSVSIMTSPLPTNQRGAGVRTPLPMDIALGRGGVANHHGKHPLGALL